MRALMLQEEKAIEKLLQSVLLIIGVDKASFDKTYRNILQ